MKQDLLKKSFGFTLLEVIIVIIIMAILATFGIARFTRSIENQKAKQGVKLLYDLYSAQKRYFIDNGAYASNFAQIAANDISVKNPPFPGYTLTLPGTSTALAEFTRTSDPYTLTINDNGIISCTSPGIGQTCSQLSY